jgi:hypothetical protein
MVLSKPQACEATMNNQAMIRLLFAGAVGLSIAGISPAYAQSTLGGAKTQQNKIGGVAKPAPVVGGSTIHTPPPGPPKTGAVANVAKPATGAITPPPAAATNTRPNAAVMTPLPDKDGKVANLKCVSGACMSKGPKP